MNRRDRPLPDGQTIQVFSISAEQIHDFTESFTVGCIVVEHTFGLC